MGPREQSMKKGRCGESERRADVARCALPCRCVAAAPRRAGDGGHAAPARHAAPLHGRPAGARERHVVGRRAALWPAAARGVAPAGGRRQADQARHGGRRLGGRGRRRGSGGRGGVAGAAARRRRRLGGGAVWAAAGSGGPPHLARFVCVERGALSVWGAWRRGDPHVERMCRRAARCGTCSRKRSSGRGCC